MNQSQVSLKQDEGPNSRRYSETFSSAEADLVLCSVDEVYFRVSSHLLRNASGFFRSTLSLPQPPMGYNTLEPEGEVLPLGEDHEVVEKLLRVVCGLGIAPSDLPSYDEVRDLLSAADKYEMPGVIAIVRLAITAPRFIQDPLQLYGLSCRYGWLDEARLASRLSLDVDLTDPELGPTLDSLNGQDLMKLMRLRWTRRALLKEGLDDNSLFAANLDTMYKCSRCHVSVDMGAWRELKWSILDEFDRHPSGETILAHAFLSSPRANALFEICCTTAQCRRVCFNKEGTISNIRNIVEGLPMTI